MRTIIKKITVVIFTLISKGILWRHKPRIIAVTGSVGKTSTTDAIYAVLKNHSSVRRSEKNFGSELSVPLTIVGAKNPLENPLVWCMALVRGIGEIILPKIRYPKTIVLEIGADRPGDIRKIAAWLRPHIVVITRLPEVPAHIEFFPTLASLIEEKLSLARGLRREGMLVLNADDSRVLEAKEKMRARTTTYGMSELSDIRGSNIALVPPTAAQEGGVTFKLDFQGKSFPVMLPNIYAESYVSVALAALTVAEVCEINMISAISDMAEYKTPPGRVHLIAGREGTLLIDDTYNSSPTACESGLKMLKDIPFGKRKIAVIGDMLQLGKHTNDAHVEIGKLAKKCADVLITVGLRAKETARGAREEGMSEKKIFEYEDAVSAGEGLKELIKSGDVILIKGSQRMRMEHTVKMLMAEPERAGELLVRQGKEWQEKSAN